MSTHNALPYASISRVCKILNINKKSLQIIAQRAYTHYHPYDIQEVKGDGTIKWRHIDNPNIVLKDLQKRIHDVILKPMLLTLPDGMIGGVTGKTIMDNARPHIRQEVVVTIDIKNCYPCTSTQAIFRVWRNQVGCGEETAKIFTQLTTYHKRLPQGSPVSSALCNLSLLPMFNEIKAYTDLHDISFTLYVDDITISGKTLHVFPAIAVIIGIIRSYGYAVSTRKIRKMPSSVQQKVTGTIVNRKVHIAHLKVEDLRKLMLQIAKTGELTKNQLESINGRIAQIERLSPGKGQKLKELREMLFEEIAVSESYASSAVTRPCKRHNNRLHT